MDTRTVEVDTPDGAMPVYEAIPRSPKAAVIVIQEVFGVTDHIQDVTRRAADAGFHAVAPALFHRDGSPTLSYADFGAVLPYMAKINDETVTTDVDATIAYLNSQGWGTPQIGLVGFCFGGRISFLVATSRAIGASVGFYGGGIVSPRFEHFPPLVDRAPDLKSPWLGLFGDADESIPLEDVERLRTELGANTPVPHEIVVYEGAGHGFHCDARPQHFNEQAAKEAWQRTVEFLDTHLTTVPENA